MLSTEGWNGSACGTSTKSLSHAFGPTLTDPSGRATLRSASVPGASAGDAAVRRVGPTYVTPPTAAPPIVTAAPLAKSKPATVTGVPPAGGPELGVIVVPGGTSRPIRSPCTSVNQRLPSGPTAIPLSPAAWLGIANSVAVPAVVVQPNGAIIIGQDEEYRVLTNFQSAPGTNNWTGWSAPGWNNAPLSYELTACGQNNGRAQIWAITLKGTLTSIVQRPDALWPNHWSDEDK